MRGAEMQPVFIEENRAGVPAEAGPRVDPAGEIT
jgi:hypothetical protein